MNIKRITALLLSLALLVGMLSGCGTTVVVGPEGDKTPSSSAPAPEQTTPADPVQPAGGGSVKTGLYVSTSLGSSKDASAEGDGVAQSEITLIAVINAINCGSAVIVMTSA